MVAENGTNNGNKYRLNAEHLEKLKQRAQARGVTVEEYVQLLIKEALERPEEEE